MIIKVPGLVNVHGDPPFQNKCSIYFDTSEIVAVMISDGRTDASVVLARGGAPIYVREMTEELWAWTRGEFGKPILTRMVENGERLIVEGRALQGASEKQMNRANACLKKLDRLKPGNGKG